MCCAVLFKCCGIFCTSCCFMLIGPVGICVLGRLILHGGLAQDPIVVTSRYSVIAWQGQPELFPAHSAEGFANLPEGIIWYFGIQPPDDQGVMYIADSEVKFPTSDSLTLSALLELARERNATLLPEFSTGGDLTDMIWNETDVTSTASLLCDQSEWMQTFHHPMTKAIAAGCSTAKILCMRPRIVFMSVAGFTFDKLSETDCHGEGRHWSDIVPVAISRKLTKDTRPLFIFGVQSRLHAWAVSAISEVHGFYSDDAPGMLGLSEAKERFGHAFILSASWFGFFWWAVVGALMAPNFTACQKYCHGHTIAFAGIVGINLMAFVAGLVVNGSSLSGCLLGCVTSSMIGPIVYLPFKITSSWRKRRRVATEDCDSWTV